MSFESDVQQKELHQELPIKAERLKGEFYLYGGRTVFWNGKRLKCIHLKDHNECFKCGGPQICEHKKKRTNCVKGSCSLIPSAKKCIACCSKLVHRIKINPASNLCSECRRETSPEKRYVVEINMWLTDSDIRWSFQRKSVGQYADYLLQDKVVLELDHNETRYSSEHENARLSALKETIGTPTLFIIRFNPNNATKLELAEAIKEAITSNHKWLAIRYIGYSTGKNRLVYFEENREKECGSVVP